MPPKVNIYSVSKINSYIEEVFRQEGLLKNVHVKGEVGTLNFWDHGYIFLNLKEDKSVLRCMLLPSCSKKADFKIQNGMTITLVGDIVSNPKDSSYRLKAYEVFDDNEMGDAKEKLLLLIRELREEGLFDAQYKLPIPKRIKTLGFVTSETGAVINDVISEATRRDPFIQIVMYNCKVSDDSAVAGMVRGIKALEEYGAEVILVGRGGGSDEQLWVYNNRLIAEAVFECSVPVISAVGHEVHNTVLDMVADLRASTPTQGASMAVADLSVLLDNLENYRMRLNSAISHKLESVNKINYYGELLNKAMKNKIDGARSDLRLYSERLRSYHPRNKIEKERQKAQQLGDNLSLLMDKKLQVCRHELMIYIERFKGLSPLDKLNQGYAYVSARDHTLESIDDVEKEDELEIYVRDGMIKAGVIDKVLMSFDYQ